MEDNKAPVQVNLPPPTDPTEGADTAAHITHDELMELQKKHEALQEAHDNLSRSFGDHNHDDKYVSTDKIDEIASRAGKIVQDAIDKTIREDTDSGREGKEEREAATEQTSAGDGPEYTTVTIKREDGTEEGSNGKEAGSSTVRRRQGLRYRNVTVQTSQEEGSK